MSAIVCSGMCADATFTASRSVLGGAVAMIGGLVLSACGAGSPSSSAAESATSSLLPSSPVSRIEMVLVATHTPAEIPGLEVPGYLEVGPDGLLYLTNGASEILILGEGGEVVDRFGEAGAELGQFDFRRHPGDPDSDLGDVAFAEDGSIYVVEGGNKRVQRFDADWGAELTWGTEGDGPGEFLDPIGIEVSSAGEVFVVDDVRNDIQVFSADGEYLRTIGRPGSANGELRDTGNIRIGPDGTLVNADFGNGRVQAWDDQGTFAWTLGSPGTAPGEFTEPQDVAFGPAGELFVVDDSRVQLFDVGRNLIATWPDSPSVEHLGSLALVGTTLWVEAPSFGTYELEVTGLPGAP